MNAELPATRTLLNRARQHVGERDLGRLVPNDPGTPEYMKAITSVLQYGESEIDCDFFAITETINQTRWSSRQDPVALWFRLLTSSVEILLEKEDPWSEYRLTLTLLLHDALALEEMGDNDAPVDLLPRVVDEIEILGEPPVRPYAILSKMLLGLTTPSENDRLCEQLDEAIVECLATYGADRPKKDYLWSLSVNSRMVRLWEGLIRDRFPESSPLARSTKQRLLSGP